MTSELPPHTAEVLLALDADEWKRFQQVRSTTGVTGKQVEVVLAFLIVNGAVESTRIAVPGKKGKRKVTVFRLTARGEHAANELRQTLRYEDK